jgi:predicted CXXCH cytochrome family protein
MWILALAGEPAPGEDGAILVLPSLGADPEVLKTHPLAEKCFKCHGTEVASREWAESGHAHNLATLRKSPNAADSCLSCHSSGYRPQPTLAWGIRQPRPYATLRTAINEVACSSCHAHTAPKERQYLVLPAKDLCVTCHKMDCGCAGKGIIHQSQSEMFQGVKAAGVPDTPSKHTETMDGDCAVCHMYRPPDSDGVVLRSGGHTFRATWDSCTPCHEDAQERVAANTASIQELLQRVEAALGAVDASRREEPAYQGAKLNYDMVRGDSGVGLHNPTYAKALLRQSLVFLGVSREPLPPDEVGATAAPPARPAQK